MTARGQRRVLLGIVACLLGFPSAAAAQTSSTTTAAQESAIRTKLAQGIGAKLNATSVTSLADAEALAKAFNAYLRERTGHGLSQATVLRLAQAEWLARVKGEGTVPVRQLASLASQSFLEKLGGPNATAPTSTVGTPWYVVTPEKINAARLLHRRHARGVTNSKLPEQPGDLGPNSRDPSVQRAFPIEALIALYVCVSEDLGFTVTAVEADWRTRRGNTTAAPKGKPYGDHGYLLRRPISRLLTDEIINRILDLTS